MRTQNHHQNCMSSIPTRPALNTMPGSALCHVLQSLCLIAPNWSTSLLPLPKKTKALRDEAGGGKMWYMSLSLTGCSQGTHLGMCHRRDFSFKVDSGLGLGDPSGKILGDLGQCWNLEANLCTDVHSNWWHDKSGKQNQEIGAAQSFTHFRGLLKGKVI